MPVFLNSRSARGVEMIYSFRLSGKEGGEYSLAISNGICTFKEGVHQHPTVLIEGSAQAWIDISLHKIKPWKPFLRKDLHITKGGLLSLIKFGRLFSGDPESTDVPEGLYSETDNEKEWRQGIKKPVSTVLAIQASPRGKAGATEKMFGPIVEGLKLGGATVTEIYITDVDIKPCTGCYSCWQQTDGVCVLNDDMANILSLIPTCDLVLFVAPVYTGTVPGKLKNFFDRQLPLLHPYIFNKNGKTLHPSRNKRMPNMALVSLCGYYEMESFDALLKWAETEASNSHMPLIAKLLRPHCMTLLGESQFANIGEVYSALRDAGRQLAIKGEVAKSTVKAISEPIVPRNMFLAGAKVWWKEEYNILKSTPKC